ncbi:MAG: flagellar basal body P-ring formation protein FlgA [Hyphomicrobiales bacterium]|nr:MAG: flagellar basal body P-ring formation protein FlgA [Hyphomicrobiales bacterium]
MTLTKLLALAAFSLPLSTAALAAPSLKADVTVTAEIVTVGDMFEDAGSMAELALFRAPKPGTTGIVDLSAVSQAAKLVGLTEFENVGVARVRVSRAATVVDAPMLEDLLTDDLHRRGILLDGVTPRLAFDTPNLSYNAEAVEEPVTLVNLRYMPGSSTFSARIQIAGVDLPVDVAGRIEMMVEAPHLIATRPAGTVLTPSDIEMKLVPLKYAESTGIVGMDQLVGRQLERSGRAGLMLRAGDVADPQVITRNQMVTVYLKSGPMTLTVKGQALNNAAAGQPVQVMNTASKKIVIGTALPNGGVDMTSTLNVAGL